MQFRIGVIAIFRLFSLLLLVPALLFFAFSGQPETSAETLTSHPEGISYSKKQSRTAEEVVRRLRRHHYRDLKFDDELSSELFTSYFDNLDPGKSFFTQADIQRFEQHRFQLDDQIKKGDVSTGFAIFSRYQALLVSRLNDNLERLPALLKNFDYSKSEYLQTDRSTAEWSASPNALDELWRKRIKANALNLRLADKTDEEIEDILAKRYKNQLLRLEQMKSQDVFQLFINTLGQLYDPHTGYLSPRTSENFNINMSLSLQGIGAVLQREEEYTQVVRLVPAGPADKEGQLQPQDKIVSVGQGAKGEMVDVVGWRLDDVVDLIRGKQGSRVRLEVIPAKAISDSDRKIITIVRETVKLEEQSAQKEVIELVHNDEQHKIGVINLPTFYIDFDARRKGDPNYRSSTRDVMRLIDELEKENVSGIIIDLRDNGGGALYEANALTRLFIDSGPAVQIRHANSRIDQEPRASRQRAYYSGPLMVMINRLSASASEIFAAAIQDYGRGIIVGSQSFGKGTVQSLSELTEGQLKLTESKYYRVSGGSTQSRGVIPDISYPELYDISEVGESALDNAMQWDTIPAVRHSDYYPLIENIGRLQDAHEKRVQDNADFVFFRDQITLLEKARQRTNISLNEAERRAQQKSDKAEQLRIENKRRISKGEEPLSSLEEDEDTDSLAARTDDSSATGAAQSESSEQEREQAEQVEEAEEEAEPDAYVIESGQILLDSLPLFQGIAKNHTQPRGLLINKP